MTRSAPMVGILGLQGDYQKHQQVLAKRNIPSRIVRTADDFEAVDRLIIPGGESTVMRELLKRMGMEASFASFIKSRPVWGTCAGMILLASKVNDGSVNPFGIIDIAVDRNGYGRQYFSSVEPADIELNGHREKLNLVFIRAPRVTSVGNDIRILLEWSGDPVLLSQNNALVSSFHPELTGSYLLHEYFANKFPEPPA